MRTGPHVGVHVRVIVGVGRGVLLFRELFVERGFEDVGDDIEAERITTYVVDVGAKERVERCATMRRGGSQKQCLNARQPRF